MGYTENEIRATVEKLLLSVIRRPISSLGTRNVAATFSDIQEAAAGVYMLYYRAPFYTVYLGAQRLLDELRTLQDPTDNLLTALDVLRRRVLPIRDVSSLVNAKVALFELEGAVSSQNVTDVTRVPAYVRFNQNINRFLSQATAVKKNGAIVPTPQEARMSISSLVSSFNTSVTQVKEKVGYLQGSIDDFSAVGLPKLVSSSVIAKARTLVEQRSDQMEGLDEVSRLEVLRETVLDLLGVKAAVTKFGSAPSMGSEIPMTGNVYAFADSSRPALPASIVSDNKGPFVTLPDDGTYQLQIWLNGAVPPPAPPALQVPSPDEVFYFPVSFYARVEGTTAEPLTIIAGLNDSLVLLINDSTTVTAPITAGAAQTVGQVCADINAAFDGVYGAGLSPFIAEPYFAPLKYDGLLNVVAADTVEVLQAAFGLTFPIDPSTGQSYIKVGDKITFYASLSSGTYTVTSILPSAANPQQFVLSAATLVVGDNQTAQAGDPLQRVRVVPRDKRQSCLAKDKVQIKTPDSISANCATTLGYYGEVVSTSRPTDATVLATYINEHSSKVKGSTVLWPVLTDVQLRTDPARAQRMAVFYHRGSCSYPTGGPGVVAVTLDSLPSDQSVLLGATLALRNGYNPDAYGVITSVGTPSGTTLPVQVNFTTAIVASSGVLAEIGPSSGIQADMKVSVALGRNTGEYYVDNVTSIPFEFNIRDTTPLYKDAYAQPEFMRASIGWESLVITSVDTTTATEVTVRDDALLLFPTTGPYSSVGRTNYLLLPSSPRELEEGNIIEMYLVFGTPIGAYTITDLYADKVVRLDSTVDTTFSGNFGSVPPYLRIKKNKVVDFDLFKADLTTWAGRPDVASLPRYFIDLNRLVNPLLQNENAQGTDVVAAMNRVRDMYSLLLRSAAIASGTDPEVTLEAALEQYVVDVVGEVDALIQTFKERGADRATEFLLQGRFSSFFGLDREDVSYAGSFQKSMREVAREDLPVRKVDRYDQRTGPVISSGRSPNYEYDSSDLDPAPAPDVPDM